MKYKKNCSSSLLHAASKLSIPDRADGNYVACPAQLIRSSRSSFIYLTIVSFSLFCFSFPPSKYTDRPLSTRRHAPHSLVRPFTGAVGAVGSRVDRISESGFGSTARICRIFPDSVPDVAPKTTVARARVEPASRENGLPSGQQQ